LSAPNGATFDFGWISTYVLPKLAHGVTLFFTLSGFLLFLPFAAAALRGEPRPSFAAYLRNRALRILPAYWFVLFVTALLLQSARVHEGGLARGIGGITDPWLLLSNALLLQNYSPSTVNTGLSPAWSLSVEAIFYCVLPLLVLAGVRFATTPSGHGMRAARLAAPAVLLGVVGVLSVVLGPKGGSALFEAGLTWSNVWDVSFMTHAHLFALGMVLSIVRVQYQDGRLTLPRGWRPAAWAGTVGFAVAGVKLGADGIVPERVEVSLIACACALLLALVVLPDRESRRPIVRALQSRPMVAGGVASYSVYLWHVPVILFLTKHDVSRAGGADAFFLNLTMVATITGVLAWLTYVYVEKPALRRKSRTTAGPPAEDPPSTAKTSTAAGSIAPSPSAPS